MTDFSTQIATAPAVSPELQQWLARRDSLNDLKIKYQKNNSLIALLPEATDPHTLPDPLRSEAIAYLCTPEKERITTREAFLKAFQLKVKYI